MIQSTEVDQLLKEYKSLQAEIQKLYGQTQESHRQLNENLLVKGEMDLLSADSNVYKLVGPVLLTVEKDEAKDNVAKRIQFIEKELERLQVLTDAKVKAQSEIGNQIAEMQQKMQMEAATAAGRVIGN